jgi:hypothetical protein
MDPTQTLPEPHILREMFRRSANEPDLILKGAGVWRYDFAQHDLTEEDVNLIAQRIRLFGALDVEDASLVFKAIDHGLVEPRSCSTKKLWSATYFPLTMRGFRAIIMAEQGFTTVQKLSEFTYDSQTPDWPLERKAKALLDEYSKWNWVTLGRRKMTYGMGDALNNDILFIVRPNEEVYLPDDDVVLFRLRYEPPKDKSVI